MIHLPHSLPQEPLIFPIEGLCDEQQEIHSFDQLQDHLQAWLEKNLGHAPRSEDFNPDKNGLARACDEISNAWRYQSVSLNLRNNGLSNLPGVVGQLYHVEEMDLSRNQLESLPQEISHLTKLTSLRLSFNPLSEANWELLNTLRLKSLIIDHSPLTRFPDELVTLAAAGVKISFANHTLDPDAMASATRRLIRANAIGNVEFISPIERIAERFSRTRTSSVNPYKSPTRSRNVTRHTPFGRPQFRLPANAQAEATTRQTPEEPRKVAD